MFIQVFLLILSASLIHTKSLHRSSKSMDVQNKEREVKSTFYEFVQEMILHKNHTHDPVTYKPDAEGFVNDQYKVKSGVLPEAKSIRLKRSVETTTIEPSISRLWQFLEADRYTTENFQWTQNSTLATSTAKSFNEYFLPEDSNKNFVEYSFKNDSTTQQIEFTTEIAEEEVKEEDVGYVLLDKKSTSLDKTTKAPKEHNEEFWDFTNFEFAEDSRKRPQVVPVEDDFMDVSPDLPKSYLIFPKLKDNNVSSLS